MKTIYVGHDGSKMEMDHTDIEVKVPILFRYYKTMDSFSLFIDPPMEQIKQAKKNIKKHPEHFVYVNGTLKCPSLDFSNMEAWEVEGMEDMPPDMYERMTHYWQGFTHHWFATYCNENTRLWRGNDTTINDKFYLTDTIISEAHDCTFILSGNHNGIRFSQLSNVLIHILGDYYEVE